MGLWFAVVVRRRGLARVPAVFRNLGFQGADACQKILKLRLHGQNDVDKDKGRSERNGFNLFPGEYPKRGGQGSHRSLGILREEGTLLFMPLPYQIEQEMLSSLQKLLWVRGDEPLNKYPGPSISLGP